MTNLNFTLNDEQITSLTRFQNSIESVQQLNSLIPSEIEYSNLLNLVAQDLQTSYLNLLASGVFNPSNLNRGDPQ